MYSCNVFVSMILRKYLFFVFICVTFLGVAQHAKIKTFVLDWDMSSDLTTSHGASWELPLVKGNFVDEDGLPAYVTMWGIESGTDKVRYSLKNIVYEVVDKKYLQSIPFEKLPSLVESSLKISKSPLATDLTFEMTPLIKEGAIVKKVVSFEVEYTLSKSQKKFQKTSVVENSVLSTGRWYKFSVHRTGVFKIDSKLLNELGISTTNLDPRNIRIYGNGGAMLPNLNSAPRYEDLQENSIYISGEDDGEFDTGDFILFYAKGAHDWLLSNENSIAHRKNIYSEEA